MGFVENGFIVDVTHARKTSEIIYELSAVLDLPEAKGKDVCVKFGNADLTKTQLISIKAMVESMGANLKCITTESKVTMESALELDLEVKNIENKIQPLEFANNDEDENEEVNKELQAALDKIFSGETQANQNSSSEPIQNFENSERTESSELTREDNSLQKFEKKEEDESVMVSAKIQYVEDWEDTEEIKAHLKETEMLPTLYIQRTLRSGQSISSDGNIVVVGDVNPGSEIIAKGDITVWGILGGIAHAGSEGNSYARIRALKMNAIQLRIADIFARRPDSINIPYVQKSDSYIPEEACVRRGNIIIHKIHES